MNEGLLIGQAARILNCNKSYLRFYESEFNLSIPRSESNRRIYTSREMEKFRYIDRLKNDGYTNAQIKAVLNSERINKMSYKDTDDILSDENTQSDNQNEGERNLAEIYEIISKLRDEIIDIKSSGECMEKNELIKENELLKTKLKQKTYELVETRERLTNIKKAGQKRLFKI